MRSSVGLWLSVGFVAALACASPKPLTVDGGSSSGGATGSAGTPGVTGIAGATGSAGTTYVTGTAGATNVTGTAGATGAGGMTTTSAGGKLFDVCLDASGCSGGLLQCYCGICTTPCMTDSWCAGFPASAAASSTCPDTIPWTSACIGSPLQSMCAIECMIDSDCLALGPTGVCSAGWCRRPLLVTVADGAVVTCTDRAAEMKAKLDPVVASADRACMNNADCVLAPLGNACYGDGCSSVAVTTEGAATIEAELKILQDQHCDAAFRAGCVGPGHVNCPGEGPPVCVNNQCQPNTLPLSPP
jgi:hypothetical protein